MKGVNAWTRSKEGVHGPGVHVLSSPVRSGGPRTGGQSFRVTLIIKGKMLFLLATSYNNAALVVSSQYGNSFWSTSQHKFFSSAFH